MILIEILKGTGHELDNLKNTAESIRETRARLIALGNSRKGADNAIFLELGGDDCVNIGDDGVARYECSGVPVGSINWPPEDKK